MKVIKKILGMLFYIFAILMDKFSHFMRLELVRSIWLFNIWKVRLKFLGVGTYIYPSVVIHNPQMVSIGKNCSVAEFVHMWGGGGIDIFDNVLIASHVVIASITHDTNALIYSQSNVKKKVIINRNVWIGAGAIILPGVEIGEGAIIGAGCVVTKDVDAFTVNAGVPSRKIKKIRNK